MEIKRTAHIFEEQFKLSKPETAGEFTKHLVKKWVAVDDIPKKIYEVFAKRHGGIHVYCRMCELQKELLNALTQNSK